MPIPDTKVFDWLNRQPRTSVWTTSITVFEVSFGLRIMAEGRRRTALIEEFAGVLQDLGQRILMFDTDAAAARRRVDGGTSQGRPARELRDTMIAGIVSSHHASLATRNIAHFEDAGIPTD
jgi:toxin FitB